MCPQFCGSNVVTFMNLKYSTWNESTERAAAPVKGTKGITKWVRVKISSRIIHGTMPVSPPCEKSASHCSEGRQNGERGTCGERKCMETIFMGDK